MYIRTNMIYTPAPHLDNTLAILRPWSEYVQARYISLSHLSSILQVYDDVRLSFTILLFVLNHFHILYLYPCMVDNNDLNCNKSVAFYNEPIYELDG